MRKLGCRQDSRVMRDQFPLFSGIHNFVSFDAMRWLDKPYPKIDDPKIALAVSLGTGIVCFLILSIFEPFGISDIEVDKSFFLFRFGLNGTIVLLIFYFLIPKIFPFLFTESQWKIKNHVIFYFMVMVLITIFNYILNSTAGADFSPQHGLLKFFYITATVGAFPILIITYVTEKVERGRNEDQAQVLNKEKELTKSTIRKEQQIVISSDTNKSETLILPLSEFLYAQAQSNYTQIYLKKDDAIETKLMRISLKNIEEQIDKSDQIIRCHKSYLINKSNIHNIEGNARSLYVMMEGTETQIPVSRSLDRALLI